MAAFKQSPYFEFLNRRSEPGQDAFIEASVEDRDYINWNHYALPLDFGDAVLYKIADDDYVMMPSDIDHTPYFESLRNQLELADVSFEECTDKWCGLNLDIPGYGLTVIDTCRMEGGFVVAGWDFATELDPEPGMERSPLEVGLGWLVNLDACVFPGREALRTERQSGSQYVFRTFSLDKNIKLDERAKLYSGPGSDQDVIGIMTSASWSWGFQKTLGNASIDSKLEELETAWVLCGGDWVEMTLRQGPLLSLSYRNDVPAPAV